MRKNCLRLLIVIVAISITGNCWGQKGDATDLSKIIGRRNAATSTTGLRTAIDCSPVTKSGCNYISNPVFSFTPGTNTSFEIFDEGNVPFWMPATGTADLSPPWTSTVNPPMTPNSNFAYMLASSDYSRREIFVEGIAQKIPRLRAGESYSLSFFLTKPDLVGFGGWDIGTMDKFNIVLMHCADAASTFPPYGTWAMPNIPAASQQVVCLYNVSYTSWEQFFIGFTADDDYDMILIYPEISYRPFQTFPNNSDPNIYMSAVGFAYPELTASQDLAITTALDNRCNVVLSVQCGVANAEYTWYDPNGNPIGQGSSVSVPAGRPGTYRVSMTVPPSGYSSNNGCSNNNPTITAQINLTQLTGAGASALQMTKADATYDIHPDGINTFSSGEQTINFLSPASCSSYNIFSACRFTDEGDITFNLSSNQSHGNIWEIYRDHQLVPTASGNTIIVAPVPDNTLQDYNPVISFIGFTAPTTFEIRLTNTILHETKSLFFILKPQAILYTGNCATVSSPSGWLSTAVNSYYTTPSTQYVWDLSNAPGSFQYSQSSPTDPNIVFDPNSLSAAFATSVRTVGSQYGCERMRSATISPLPYQCYGSQARAGVVDSRKDNTGNEKLANALLLYPNPATSMVNVVTKKNIEQIGILSIDGRKIRSVTTTGTRTILPVTQLQKGTYLLVIKYKDGTWENKLIIKQ